MILSMKTPPQEQSVKIKQETYRLIKKMAKRSHRTIQGEISHVMEWYMAQVGRWPLKG